MDADSSTNTARKDASELAAAEAAAREKAANARLRAEAARAAIAAAEAAEEAALAAADAAAEARRVNNLAASSGSAGARGYESNQQSPGALGDTAAEAHATASASAAAAAAKVERERNLDLKKESQRRHDEELKRRDRAVEEERTRRALAEEDRQRQARVREAEEKERAKRALIEEDHRWQRKAREAEEKERANRTRIDEDNQLQRKAREAEKTEVSWRMEADASDATNHQARRELIRQERSDFDRFVITEAARQARASKDGQSAEPGYKPTGRSERERMEAVSHAEAARETALREAAEAKAKIHYLEAALQAQIDSRNAEKIRRKELKRKEKKKAKKMKKEKKRASQHRDDKDATSVALEVSQVEENLSLMKQSIKGKTFEISRAKKEAQELAEALAFEESELLQESEALLKRQARKDLHDANKVNGMSTLSAEKSTIERQHSIAQRDDASSHMADSNEEGSHQIDRSQIQAYDSELKAVGESNTTTGLNETPNQLERSQLAAESAAAAVNAGDDLSTCSELSPPPPPPSVSASDEDEDESIHESLEDENSDDSEVEEEEERDDAGSQEHSGSNANPLIEKSNVTDVALTSASSEVQFAVGDQVDVKDDEEEEWEPGTVLEVDADGSPQVQKDGYDKAYTWEHVRHSPLESNRKFVENPVAAEFAVNDRVDVRDDPDEEWEPGTVTEFDEDGAPQVQKDGYDTAYSWEFIRLREEQAGEPAVGMAEPKLNDGASVDKNEVNVSAIKDATETSVISRSPAPAENDFKSKEKSENIEFENNSDQDEVLLAANETSTRNVEGDELGMGMVTSTVSPRSPKVDSRPETSTPGKKATLSREGTSIIQKTTVASSQPSGEDDADEVSESESSRSTSSSSGRSGPIESVLSELTVSDDEGILTPANVVVKLEATKKEQPEYKAVPPVAREEVKNDEEVYAEWSQPNPARSMNGGYEKVRFDDRDNYDDGPSWHSALADIVAHRQMLWAIMPPIWLLSFFSYLDRCNLAFVSEEVQQDLDLTDSQYGLGAGIFFVSYTLFQVPSQMILVRVGTRTWLGMMAFAWGLACCAMAFSTDAEYFYRARFALGLTEAGFFPGVISYLRTFVPMSKFSYAFGLISSACCVAMVMGGPIAAVVFKLTKDTDTDKLSADQEEIDGPMGLTTWQWLFLCQGAPVVLLGLILPCWLPSEPSEIVFKGPEASNLRKVYLQRLKSESFANAARAEKSDDEELATLKEKTVAGCATLCSLCFEPRMWAFATSIFFHSLGFWGVIFWVPRVVGGVLASSSSLGKTDGPDSSDSHGFAAVHLSHHAVKIFHETNSTHLSPDVLDLQIANFKTVSVVVLLLSAIPYMGAVVGNLWVAWHSDKYNERKMHVIGACALGSFGLVLTASTLHRPMLNLLALTLTAGAFWGVSGPFWGFVNLLTPDDQEAAIMSSLINTFGSCGGIFGPIIVGYIHEKYDSYRPALFFLAVTELIATIPLCYCLAEPKYVGRISSKDKIKRAAIH